MSFQKQRLKLLWLLILPLNEEDSMTISLLLGITRCTHVHVSKFASLIKTFF